jgi:hypothetical protein
MIALLFGVTVLLVGMASALRCQRTSHVLIS